MRREKFIERPKDDTHPNGWTKRVCDFHELDLNESGYTVMWDVKWKCWQIIKSIK